MTFQEPSFKERAISYVIVIKRLRKMSSVPRWICCVEVIKDLDKWSFRVEEYKS